MKIRDARINDLEVIRETWGPLTPIVGWTTVDWMTVDRLVAD